jgi:hypothetical protein
MGSLLNFVFLSDDLEKNGPDGFSICGPLFWYIMNNNYSYTLNGKLKEGFRNIVMIEGNNSLDSFKDIPNDILQFVLNNDVKLLAVSLADPSNSFAYKNAKLNLEKILPNKFYILDSNSALEGCLTVDYFLEEANYPRQKNSNFGIINDLGYLSEEIQISELNNFREKKFLSFNKTTDKPHRASLLHEYLMNNYSDSYFSFINKLEYLGDIPNIGDIRDNYDFYNSKLPIELDTQLTSNKTSFNVSSTFKKELFLNSCINIVTETSFENNELFVSEKVLKPILMFQPFIMLGPYHYLKHIKERYGFKTFSEFWDESYDEIEDYRERLYVIINLIREFNNKSIQELNEIYQKTKDICIYNRRLLDSMELDSFPQIFKQIENEW